MLQGDWYKATMVSYPGTGTPKRCDFQFSDDGIRIRYRQNGMMVTYAGREVSEGHFRLEADVISGRATLHRFASDTEFEGALAEGDQTGLWSISVSEQTTD